MRMTKGNTQSQNTQWIQGTICRETRDTLEERQETPWQGDKRHLGRETKDTLAGRQEEIQRDRKHLGRETGDNRVER
jgi:hypothetical protein